MRNSLTRAIGALVLILTGALAAPTFAGPRDQEAGQAPDISRSSVLTIPHNATFPLTKKVALGTGRSFLVQFPFELKDVLVADPNKVDAVVQSSDRVFLIAKKAGQTNAFFFDANGQQVLTVEIAVGADLSALDALIRRLIPGSNVKSEMAGKALVLTGSVRTPLDSNRAGDIAEKFIEANTDLIQSGTSQSTGGGATAPGGSSFSANFQMQPNGKGGGGSDGQKQVINLLTVEGEEQVMLKVTVAEVQRAILKQFGINLGALINSGNFTTAILSQNALPITAAAAGLVANASGVSDVLDPAGRVLSLHESDGRGAPIGSLAFSADGQTLLSASRERLRVWRADTGSESNALNSNSNATTP